MLTSYSVEKSLDGHGETYQHVQPMDVTPLPIVARNDNESEGTPLPLITIRDEVNKDDDSDIKRQYVSYLLFFPCITTPLVKFR